VSRGSGHASGWNWMLKIGLNRALVPSLVPSFKFTNQGSQSRGRVRSLTA
jgi:hypothetical protein